MPLAGGEIVLDGVIRGVIRTNESGSGHDRMGFGRERKARIAIKLRGPIEQRQIGHRVDCRRAAPALIIVRPPRRDVAALRSHDQPAPQLLGRAQRQIAITLFAGNVVRGDRTRIEDETDIVGVAVGRTRRHQQQPLISKFQIFLIAGAQIGNQEKPHPESAEPVAMAPIGAAVAGRNRRRHRHPGARWRRYIRKVHAERRLVFQQFPGAKIQRIQEKSVRHGDNLARFAKGAAAHDASRRPLSQKTISV